MLNGPYTDNWGYQDNILCKYHAKSGNSTSIITTTEYWNENGELCDQEEQEYISADGVRVIRLKNKSRVWGFIFNKINYYPVFALIDKLSPDLIMVHGLNDFAILDTVRYVKKNEKCCIVADTHELSYQIIQNRGSKYKVWKVLNLLKNKYVERYIETIYAITPEAQELAIKQWKLEKKKFKLLPLGYDDELVNKYLRNKKELNFKIRERYNIGIDERLLITGGKLNDGKRVFELLAAFRNMGDYPVRLLVFGDGDSEEYRKKLRQAICESKGKAEHIGFLSQAEIYELSMAADLAIFLGTESALWQQMIGAGVPLMVKRWAGTDYLDIGGNIYFIEDIEVENVRKSLQWILEMDRLDKMKAIALGPEREFFSYKRESEEILKNANH